MSRMRNRPCAPAFLALLFLWGCGGQTTITRVHKLSNARFLGGDSVLLVRSAYDHVVETSLGGGNYSTNAADTLVIHRRASAVTTPLRTFPTSGREKLGEISVQPPKLFYSYGFNLEARIRVENLETGETASVAGEWTGQEHISHRGGFIFSSVHLYDMATGRRVQENFTPNGMICLFYDEETQTLLIYNAFTGQVGFYDRATKAFTATWTIDRCPITWYGDLGRSLLMRIQSEVYAYPVSALLDRSARLPAKLPIKSGHSLSDFNSSDGSRLYVFDAALGQDSGPILLTDSTGTVLSELK